MATSGRRGLQRPQGDAVEWLTRPRNPSGTREGAILSPWLYSVFIDSLLQRLSLPGASRSGSRASICPPSAADPMFKKVYKSYSDFQSNVMKYHQISEFEYYKNRAGYNQ
jgi:hypothetical protein